jgi:hypothetical protein
MSVAKSARVPALLGWLAKDADDGVRLAVFYNRHTPPELKRTLDRDPRVLWRRQYG